jgi:hypothetical protein
LLNNLCKITNSSMSIIMAKPTVFSINNSSIND